MMWDGKERRKHKRYGIKESTVRYRKAGPASVFRSPSKRYLVLNLSEGGLHFITETPFQEGNRLLLEVQAPGMSGSVKGDGRVVWNRKSKEHDAYRVGVLWTRLNPRNRDKLRLLLENAILDKIEITTRIYLKEIEKL